MTRVMICGTRRKEDIDLLVRTGVDAIGLITEVRQKIECNLSRKDAANFARMIPPFVSSILILTEERAEEVINITEAVKPHVLQLHGFNEPEDLFLIKKNLRLKVIKTLHFAGETMAEPGDPLKLAAEYISAGADAIMVDSFQADRVGATGEIMELGLARRLRDAIFPVPLVLAGGLNSDNVTFAVTRVRPFAVDALSGLVTSGFLDTKKVSFFINQVRMVRE